LQQAVDNIQVPAEIKDVEVYKKQNVVRSFQNINFQSKVLSSSLARINNMS